MINPIVTLLMLSSPLVAFYLYSKVVGRPLLLSKVACWGLGMAFLFFFLGHFVKTGGMVEMLPVWVPLRLELVYLTGVLELVIAIALFLPRYQVRAAKIAIFVLVLFFPVNIYSAINAIGLGGHKWGPIYLFIRAPLQIVLVSWAYFLCVAGHRKVLNLKPWVASKHAVCAQG